eukprot:COSAG02_NODE_41307_length_396_cov_0.538721_1_plen_23_part_10
MSAPGQVIRIALALAEAMVDSLI